MKEQDQLQTKVAGDIPVIKVDAEHNLVRLEHTKSLFPRIRETVAIPVEKFTDQINDVDSDSFDGMVQNLFEGHSHQDIDAVWTTQRGVEVLVKSDELESGETVETKMSGEIMEQVISHLPFFFFLLSEDTLDFEYISPQADYIIGIQAAREMEVIHLSEIDGFIHEEDKGVYNKIYSYFKDPENKQLTVRFRIFSDNGNWVWIQSRLSREVNPDGSKSILGIAFDISNTQSIVQELNITKDRLDQLAAVSPIGIFRLNSDLTCIYSNQQGEKMVGRSYQEISEKRFFDFFSPLDESEIQRNLYALQNNDTPKPFEARIKDRDGVLRWFRCSIAREGKQDEDAYILVLSDVDELKKANEIVQSNRKFLIQLSDTLPQAITIVDIEHEKFIYRNKNAIQLLYSDDEECELGIFWERIHPDDLANAQNFYNSACVHAQSDEVFEFRIRAGNKWSWMKMTCAIFEYTFWGQVSQLLITLEDVNTRKQLEVKLIRDAMYDRLTNLPNRAAFLETLGTLMIDEKQERDSYLTVFFLDMDRFKLVNDSLGHDVGDKLLIKVAQRLTETLGEEGFVARLAGDEFVVLVEHMNERSKVGKMADKMYNILARPYNIDSYSIYSTPSIGIVSFKDGYKDPKEVVRDADIAMYRAKRQKGTHYEIFNNEMRAGVVMLQSLEYDLRQALENGGQGFQLAYMPIVSSASNEVVACEALLRWQHPEKGEISPSSFIPIAEETGLIVELDRWVLRKSCQQLNKWQDQYGVKISVNLSSLHFRSSQYTNVLQNIWEEELVVPQLLQLEITEGAILDSKDVAEEILHNFRRSGVKLALDDFGTGYSSLSYLAKLPIDVLKIDLSFVRDMNQDPSARNITQMIINLGIALGMEVVAEGVEDTQQLSTLRSYGCHLIQGYLYSPGVYAPEFVKVLEEINTR